MTLDLSHLAGTARKQVFQDAKARIRIVRTARRVGFSRAQLAVEELERRYDFPTCARTPCLLLYGDSGMGKTMILEKMERQHPSTHDERRGITVLTVQMPPSPDERRFYTRILEVLGAPYSIRDQIGSLEGRVIHLLQKLGTKLLFIDEVHHLLAGSQREQRRALNLLKFLSNELKIVMVVVGTSDAFHALQTDQQVASRFEPVRHALLAKSWCTICRKHSYPLVVRRDDGFLSRKNLLSDVNCLAANRYRNLTVPLNSKVRFDILAGILEIQTAIDNALHKTPPSSWLWGDLTPDEFLLVVSDLTTWSLMHFECVSAWSTAEDFSPTEEQEGYGIIGRGRRMLPSDYADPHSARTLRDFTNPKTRGAALWFAHSLMARRHEDAPDRTTVHALQDRQEARIWRSPAAARDWLADRQQYWPPAYLEEFWIDTRSSVSLPGIGSDVTSIVGI